MREIKRLAYEIADFVCEDCARPTGCEDGCPVRKLVDIFEEEREKDDCYTSSDNNMDIV